MIMVNSIQRNVAAPHGQHTREVLLELGYTEAEVKGLAAGGVIRLG